MRVSRIAVSCLFSILLIAGPATAGAEPGADRGTGSNATPVVNRAAISAAGLGDTVTLDLPGGTTTGRVTWRQDHSPERFVIAGRLDDALGSFTLAFNGEALYGHLRRPGRPMLVLRTVAGADTLVEEVDTTAPFCDLGRHRFDPGPASETAGINDCDDGSVIDVLAVYTPDAATAAGGVAEIEAAIDLGIAENNIAWANSGLSREQNLVLAWQIDPISPQSVSLSCLIDLDGCLDQIHLLRDAFGADLVVFVDDFGASVTFGLESLDPAHEAQAFALTPYANFSNTVMSHELGHQMGCCHARGDGGGCDEGLLFPFSNGHRFEGDSGSLWKTVMAYTPGTTVLQFSNPWINYDGQPTGVPQSEPDSADNVATIDASALMVSNYRCPGPCVGSHLRGDGPDCNDNEMPDSCDITLGTSSDYNLNGVPDDCEDPCGDGPLLVVSSDPADAPDFPTIQQAVDAAVLPGTCIKVLPGTDGRYPESVVVDRELALRFRGEDHEGEPPVVDGAAAPAFDIVSTSGSVPVQFENLKLRGQTGIRTAVSTMLKQLVFEGAPTMSVALDLAGGTCRASGLRMDATVVDGIDLAAGAALNLQRSSLTGLSGTAARLAGRAALTNVLIGGADTGLVLAETGSLTIDYTTVASSQNGPGIDNSAQGYVTGRLSILYGNAGNDVIGVECRFFQRSVVGSPGCQIYWSSFEDPLLDADFVPQTGSSALERGGDAVTYSDSPCIDLPGGPRRRDHDGDGLAYADAGAFEVENTALFPGVVTNVGWGADGVMIWDPTPGAVAYHLYRSYSATLGYDHYGTCIDYRDPDRTDERFSGSFALPPGEVFFFQVTAEGVTGNEGSMGLLPCAERGRFNSCS